MPMRSSPPDGAGSAAGAADDDDVVAIEMEGDGPLVVREKFHGATPMTIDQALFEMELVGHDFFLFRDSDGGGPSVVYRRRGYQYGVIRLVEDDADERGTEPLTVPEAPEDRPRMPGPGSEPCGGRCSAPAGLREPRWPAGRRLEPPPGGRPGRMRSPARIAIALLPSHSLRRAGLRLRPARRSVRVDHAAPQAGQMPPGGAVWLAGGGSWEEASWAEAAGLPRESPESPGRPEPIRTHDR